MILISNSSKAVNNECEPKTIVNLIKDLLSILFIVQHSKTHSSRWGHAYETHCTHIHVHTHTHTPTHIHTWRSRGTHLLWVRFSVVCTVPLRPRSPPGAWPPPLCHAAPWTSADPWANSRSPPHGYPRFFGSWHKNRCLTCPPWCQLVRSVRLVFVIAYRSIKKLARQRDELSLIQKIQNRNQVGNNNQKRKKNATCRLSGQMEILKKGEGSRGFNWWAASLFQERLSDISRPKPSEKWRNIRRGKRAAKNKERRGWRNTNWEHPGERWTAPVVRSWEVQWWWLQVL